jgi:hypothetical protein
MPRDVTSAVWTACVDHDSNERTCRSYAPRRGTSDRNSDVAISLPVHQDSGSRIASSSDTPSQRGVRSSLPPCLLVVCPILTARGCGRCKLACTWLVLVSAFSSGQVD